MLYMYIFIVRKKRRGRVYMCVYIKAHPRVNYDENRCALQYEIFE